MVSSARTHIEVQSTSGFSLHEKPIKSQSPIDDILLIVMNCQLELVWTGLTGLETAEIDKKAEERFGSLENFL